MLDLVDFFTENSHSSGIGKRLHCKEKGCIVRKPVRFDDHHHTKCSLATIHTKKAYNNSVSDRQNWANDTWHVMKFK